ncbi:hypothetical protein JGS22_003360 [Streptomyces sp. P38-E01]|uniref:Secreted protein n=1 Tax=Streptomyces tardus TaxID=2780544 RepID=A0A949JK87_9ACTN|nr:hypothetical protein [Streptomyces tardus]MBU7596701.1 hypothetical protein [Streptomyces tardus]
MASRARHARPRRRRLLSAGLTLSAAGAAALAAAGSAQADIVTVDPADPLATVGHVVGPVADLQLNPMAKTGVDPLDNGIGTQIADFRPISTKDVTGPLSEGASLSDLAAPVTGLIAPAR